MKCNCGNKKCKVSALSAKTENLKAAALANPGTLYKSSGEEKLFYAHKNRLAAAEHECAARQAFIDIGHTCPFCARPVAAYGAEWSAETCMIDGKLSWRGAGWERPGPSWAENQRVCLALAWERLTEARNA